MQPRGTMPFEASTALRAVGGCAGAEWRAAGPFYVGAGIGLKHVWSHTQVGVSRPIGVQSQSLNGRSLLRMAHVDLGVQIQAIDNLYCADLCAENMVGRRATMRTDRSNLAGWAAASRRSFASDGGGRHLSSQPTCWGRTPVSTFVRPAG